MGLALKEEIKRRRTPRKSAAAILETVDLLLTPERRKRVGLDFVVGGDKRTGEVVRLTDEPLERLWRRSGLEGREYTALQKYRHHWYHSGLLPGVGSVDLNRVFASDPSNSSGMAKSEAQAHHRQQYRQAVQVMGMIATATVDRVVCHEWPLEQAGYKLGYKSPFRARMQAASELRAAGAKLARFWGIG